MLSWGILFRVRQNLKGSLWAIPLAGALLGAVFGALGIVLDEHASVPSYWQYSPGTASTLLSAIVGASAALIGFVVTVTVLVVQIATDSLSSRYMRIWFRDWMLKAVLAILLCTLTLSLQEMRRVGDTFVPNLAVTVAGFLLVLGLVFFLLFLDRALHRVRPVAVASLVAAKIRRTAEEVANDAASPDAPDFLVGSYETDETPAHVVPSVRAGSLQAIDAAGLTRLARSSGCLFVLLHAVGDFVPVGAPLFEVYGTGGTPRSLERRLQGMVALGNERTIDQDPAFGIRILVDIANLALSPAVNDPTTVVQVIDYLGETLRVIGNVDLAAHAARAPGTRPLVIVPTRSWDDLVMLALTEIREYGAKSIQVNRRLRAMLETVRDDLPSARRPAIDEELARLTASVARGFAGSADLDRASEPDQQGLGGPRHTRRIR